MVVAQLVERSLLISEVCGSNPIIGKNLFLLNIFLLCFAKTKIKKKEAGDGPFLKNKLLNEYYNPDGSFAQLALSQKDG